MIYYLLFAFALFIFFYESYNEKFTLDYNDPAYKNNYKGTRTLNDPDQIDHLSIKTDPKRQKYLQFLGKLNDKFKESMPKTGPFRGSCDDNLNDKIQKKVLNDVFSELDKQISPDRKVYKREVSSTDKTKTLDCVGMSDELCEFTNPYFYLIDSPYFPPPWSLNTYKDVDYPKNTNLSCFNKNFSCCKASLK